MTTSIETEAARYLDHLTVERGLSEHTLAAYRRDLARYLRFLAARDVTEPSKIDDSAVRSFLASVSASTHGHDERPYRATSVARTLSSVRSFHRFLLREGVTARDPAVGVARPKLPRSLPHPLTLEDIMRLLDAPDVGTPRARAIARSWSCCTARACASRSSRASTSTTSISRTVPSGCSGRAARSERCRSDGTAATRWRRTSPGRGLCSRPAAVEARCS
jgi:site-specific recombinase XerC